MAKGWCIEERVSEASHDGFVALVAGLITVVPKFLVVHNLE